MRNRKKHEVNAYKEKTIEGALQRIDTEKEDRRLRGFDERQLNYLWWKEFFIIIAPLFLWTTILLVVQMFWPITPKLIVTHTVD